MYPISEYLKQGVNLVKGNVLGIPALPTLMLYVTDACNSRCRICNIWQTKRPTHLSVASIRKLLSSPLIRQSTIGLEGGEFFLHPEYREILELLSKRGRFTLLSNGLMTDRLVESARRFNIPEVLISLDGGPETYHRVRGVDGYDRVKKSILALREFTRVSAVFTFSPWNGVKDYEEVKKFCDENNVNLKTNLFTSVPFFNIKESLKPVDGLEALKIDFPEKDYLDLYRRWLNKKVELPCLSIRVRAVMWPDGSIPLCQSKSVILGNINNQSIDEIWSSRNTKAIWKQYYSCNGCWAGFHRIYDVTLARILEKFLPKLIIKKILKVYAIYE
ncbi:MAG: radical SAM protein [Candidatus Omnitrophota bacterium]